jgi:WD40 repeat protein
MKGAVRYFAAVAVGLFASVAISVGGEEKPAVATVPAVAAAKPAPAPAPVAQLDFYQDVFPFLKKNCVSCHNKTTTKAGLNMETPKLMIEGGDTGASIIPGKSDESLLVEACLHLYDLEMPPKNNKSGAVDLTEAEVAILKTWIDQGAKDSVQEERKITWQAPAVGVQPIYTLAMTDDGRFAACGRSNQIFLYDLATRQLVGQISDPAEKPSGAHRALVQALHFSPDGNRLASGSFREVKIWKKQQAAVVNRKADPALGLLASALSPDGSKMVGADRTGALLVLNAADGKLVKKIPGGEPKGAGIQWLEVSPDASKIAVFSTADVWKLSVWDLNTGKILATQTSPDPGLEKASRDAQAKLVAVTKEEARAKAAVSSAQAAKVAATKAVTDLKAQVAKMPADSPAPELQKQVAAAETKLADATRAEAAAVAASKRAETAKVAADKAAKDSAAQLAATRKIPVRALAWTRDGKSIASAGDDKVVSVWTISAPGTASFAAPKKLAGAAAPITFLKTGATADQIVSAGSDNKARLWSISQAKVLKEIPVGVTCLDVSSDGKFLLTGDVANAVRIWDLATGKHHLQLMGSMATRKQMAALDWQVNAQGLEEAFQKTVITKIEAQEKALDVLLQKAKDAIVANNKKLPTTEKAIKPAQDAVAAAQKEVDAARATIAKAPDARADAAMDKALKAAQTKLITAKTAERSAVLAHKAVQSNITDAQEQEKRITASKAKNATDLAAAKAATEAATKAKAKAAADLAAVKAALPKNSAKPVAVSFSADDQKVAALFSDGALDVWAVADGSPIEQGKATATSAAAMQGRADGSFAALTAEGEFTGTPAASKWVLERTLGGAKNPRQFADRINTVRFSPDGKTLATGGGEASRSGDVILFDVATGTATTTWMEKHTDSVISLAFSPDGKLLASGAADKIARVTDIASGEQTHLYEGHTHYVTGVAFRADGRVLATAGADGVVNSWDMLIGERQKKIEGWTKEVTSLQFIGATNQIVTSAGDNLVRVVNDIGGQVRSIAKLPDFMQAAASTADGTTIIGGGEDSFLRVWNGADGKELVAFGPK